MPKYIFVLTYNEQELWNRIYPKDFVDRHFKPNDFHVIMLDNGHQPLMKQWCEQHGFTYHASEYNIGSSGGYNWAFKVAYTMNLDAALFMQADVEVSNAKPLLKTYKLTKRYGHQHFFIWPQHLHGFWDPSIENTPWIKQPLHNLGNLVGFNALAQFQHQCYFDENFVVTHCDDVEFVHWLGSNHKAMSCKNVAALLHHTNHYYEQTSEMRGIFVIESLTYTFKVHHASQTIEFQRSGERDFHQWWLEFNDSYYRENIRSGVVVRRPYDPSRWTRFGYPPYPVQHEIRRFFSEYPQLDVNGAELWKIPDE